MEDTRTRPDTPRPATLKRINMRRFLEELRRRGPSTRADLTRAIGVTPPTSSSIIADLMETGFLEEAEIVVVSKGRPGKFFRLATESAYVIGIAIDVGDCALTPSGLDANIRYSESKRFPTPKEYKRLLSVLAERVRRVIDATPGKCLGVGLAVPGLIDEMRGRVAFSPNLHFLDGRDLGPDLERMLGMPVACTQEEHALCLAEQSLGSANDLADFAVIDFSSGVGMGVVSGGRYVYGSHGYAGEIGHTTVVPDGILCGCGNRGCLETVASDNAFLREVRAREGMNLTFHDLETLAKDGSIDLAKDLEASLGYIAIGLATVVNIFNPSAVFLHGKLFGLDDRIMGRLEQLIAARALRPSFEGVRLELARGNKLYGAVAGLLDHLFASVGPTLG